MHLDQVEDGHAGGLAARAGGRWYGDQRLESAGDRLTAADRRVHVGEEVGRIGGVQVGGLGRVHARAAAHGDIAVECAVRREADRLLEGSGGWFYSHLNEEPARRVDG